MENAAVWVSGVLGALSGPALAFLVSRRTAAQPVSMDIEAEALLVELADSDPEACSGISLPAETFAHPGWRARWEALTTETHGRLSEAAGVWAEDGSDRPGAHPGGSEPAGSEPAGPEAPESDASDGRVEAMMSAYASAAGNGMGTSRTRADTGSAPLSGGSLADRARVATDLAKRIAACADDRNLDGARGLTESGEDDIPLVRVEKRPSGCRLAGVSVVMAAVGALVASLSSGAPSVMVPMLVLSGGLMVLSLVDIDTLYVDTETFWATTLLVWPLVAVGALRSGRTVELLVGLGATVALMIGILAIAWAYQRLRKRGGMGGGDILLLVLVSGVPATVTGEWRVAVWGVMAAMLVCIVCRLFLVVLRRAKLHDPFAFGPYLAVGWLVAWAFIEAGRP